MKRRATGTETVPDWKPERQILTASEVGDNEHYSGLYKTGGSIELRIDRFDEFVRDEQERWSAPIYIRGLPWQICAASIETSKHNQRSPSKALAFYLYCNLSSASLTWKCEAIITLRVMAQEEGVKDLIQHKHAFFGGAMLEPKNCGSSQFATCDMLLDLKKGFLNRRRRILILQAHVQPLKIETHFGLNTMANAQLFSSSTKYPWDFVVTIQDRNIHVQKSILSMHSEYFKDRFTKHKRVKGAILQGVTYDEFIELLTVIYPSLCPITAKNVETITELAFKFYMADLLKRCEEFLMENISKFDKATSLLIAEWYGFVGLQKKVIQQIKDVTDIKTMKPEYDALSDRTKRRLFDRICCQFVVKPVGNPVSEPESTGMELANTAEILKKLVSSVCCPSDGVLIVENNRIPVVKNHLAMYSEYFTAMFQGEFLEKAKDEIVLEEVGYNEFLELLAVIYPTALSITAVNVEVILKMADRFIMPATLARCKRLLQNSKEISLTRKLWLAQRYNLPDLQLEYANKCKDIYDVEKLRAKPEFGLLDDKTRVLILDSITS